MPVRFQVDPDFYDHPKTIEASDAAVALWTRAGSYSTAKLLDGFVPDGMLARLSKTPDEASAELVRRRLWKRVRGGFQFHQWDDRNLTKDRVEADREYERDKKRRQRGEARQEQNGQVKPRSVPKGRPPGQDGDISGTPEGIPAVSVSMSESVSTSVSNNQQTSSVGPRKRGTRIPDDFAVTPEMLAWAREKTPNVGRLETEKFINYWRAKTGRDATKLDWVATWRNWMISAAERTPRGQPSTQPFVERNGMRLKPETAARLDDTARWASIDAQLADNHQPAIEGTMP